MSDNDSSKIKPDDHDLSEKSEIGQYAESLFQMGQFKLLTEEELKVLQPPIEVEPESDYDEDDDLEPLNAEPVDAPDEPGSEDSKDEDGPSYFPSAQTPVHPLRLRAGHLIAKQGSAVPIASPAPAPKKFSAKEPLKVEPVADPTELSLEPEIVSAPIPEKQPIATTIPYNDPPIIAIPPRKPGFFWSLGSILLRILAFFILFFLIDTILGLSLIPVGGYLSHHLRQKSDLGFGTEMIAAFIAAWVMVHFGEKRSLADIGYAKTNPVPQFMSGSGVGAICVAVPFVASLLSFYYSPGQVNPNASLFAPLVVCLIIAVSEETVFRGYILRVIEERFGSLSGVVISCGLFALLTYARSQGLTIPEYQKVMGPLMIGFGEGLALAGAYIASRNIWMPIGLHFAALFLMGPILGFNSAYAADQGNSLMNGSFTGEFWMSGGVIGPEASVPAAVSFLIAGILLIRKAMKNGNWNGSRKQQVTSRPPAYS